MARYRHVRAEEIPTTQPWATFTVRARSLPMAVKELERLLYRAHVVTSHVRLSAEFWVARHIPRGH